MSSPTGRILVIDQGTQSVRGTLVDSDGGMEVLHSQPIETRRDGPVNEQDPAAWRSGVDAILGEAAARRERVEAIVCTAVLSSVVALDAAGRPLRPAVMYSDQRPAAYVPEIEATAAFGKIREETGWRAAAGDLLPQLLFLAREEPATYRAAAHLLDATAYLNYLLTGAFTMDEYTRLNCYGAPGGGSLPVELLAELGLDAARLGRPAPVGGTLGYCGDPPVPVISAPYDSLCAYLGAGLVNAGDALDISGTVTSFGVLSADAVKDARRRIYSIPLVAPPAWLVRGSTAFAGGTLEWARKELVRGDYDGFDRLVQSSPAGARGVVFLPHLTGERAPLWNPAARGVFYGLGAETRLADMARAVYEGVCYSLRHIQAAMEECGTPIGGIRMAGGLARMRVLNQMKADITGKVLLPLQSFELTTLGAAGIAGQAIGWYRSLAEALQSLIRTEAPVLPSDRDRPAYETAFAQYARLSEGLFGTR